MNEVPSQAAGLFQKAHGRIVMLQRIESQIASLLVQRRRLQAELGDAQSEINEELNRLMQNSDEFQAATVGNAGDLPRGNGDFVVPSAADQSGSRLD